jgi:hypothetical protein
MTRAKSQSLKKIEVKSPLELHQKITIGVWRRSRNQIPKFNYLLISTSPNYKNG